MQSKILVIIPAFNEAESIGKVVGDIPAGMVQEVVVVNNSSTDETEKMPVRLVLPWYGKISADTGLPVYEVLPMPKLKPEPIGRTSLCSSTVTTATTRINCPISFALWKRKATTW